MKGAMEVGSYVNIHDHESVRGGLCSGLTGMIVAIAENGTISSIKCITCGSNHVIYQAPREKSPTLRLSTIKASLNTQ